MPWKNISCRNGTKWRSPYTGTKGAERCFLNRVSEVRFLPGGTENDCCASATVETTIVRLKVVAELRFVRVRFSN